MIMKMVLNHVPSKEGHRLISRDASGILYEYTTWVEGKWGTE